MEHKSAPISHAIQNSQRQLGRRAAKTVRARKPARYGNVRRSLLTAALPRLVEPWAISSRRPRQRANGNNVSSQHPNARLDVNCRTTQTMRVARTSRRELPGSTSFYCIVARKMQNIERPGAAKTEEASRAFGCVGRCVHPARVAGLEPSDSGGADPQPPQQIR
jgi:hypothetical protein